MSAYRGTFLLLGTVLALSVANVCGFVVVPQIAPPIRSPATISSARRSPRTAPPDAVVRPSSSSSSDDGPATGGYVRQGDRIEKKEREPPYPKIGDVVRYFDVDGGQQDGEVLVGKISLIQPVLTKDDDDDKKWIVEISELEDVGEGYYADYPSRKRRSKRAIRSLEYVSPLAASFVRTEDAWKVPTDRGSGRPIPLFERYKVEGYEGPAAVPVDEEVVQTDLERYTDLKTKLLRDAALVGVAGALITDLVRGLDDAIVYLTGAIAGVGYLFFLSVKTDTVGSTGAKLGNNVSNFRFVLPVLVLAGVAARNLALGDASPLGGGGTANNWFSTVTKEQFAFAMLGFLTYRLPLFVTQLSPVVGESGASLLPGSAGVALQMAQEARAAKEEGGGAAGAGAFGGEDLTPVLLVCGPPGTGKTSLVDRLIADDDQGRFVAPKLVDRIRDPANFERLEVKEAFLEVDGSGRYGLTGEGILDAAGEVPASAGVEDSNGKDEKQQKDSIRQVVVVDANVDLAKKLTNLSGARLIGVWVGLDSMDKFESRLRSQIKSGDLKVPEDEAEESVIRAKVKEIVQNIEYGVTSGIFEFTILNDDFDTSLAQLKEAAEYCYK